jgi:hypothetical protein
MPAEPNYDNVTRVEIIGPGGLVFSYYCEPGVAPDVQDDGRTLKVFVGDPVPWRTAMQRADQTQEGGPLMGEVMVRIQRFDPQHLTMDSPRGNWVTLGPAMTEAEAVDALKGYRRRDRASNRRYQYRILGPDAVVRDTQRAGDQEGQQ